MNKILTQTGGQPVFLDDIDFSSQATRDAFKALCRALSLDDIGTCILQGCNVTTSITLNGTEYTWTEGYIAIKGEIYKVDAGTINSKRIPSWVIKKNRTENRTFEDESNKPVWEVSYVTLSGTYGSDEEYVPYIGIQKYNDILRDKLFSFEEIEIPATAEGQEIDVKITVHKYAAFKRIIVEISELEDYYPSPLMKIVFDNQYYDMVKDIVLSGFTKSGEFLMMGFMKNDVVLGLARTMFDEEISKGFNTLTLKAII